MFSSWSWHAKIFLGDRKRVQYVDSLICIQPTQVESPISHMLLQVITARVISEGRAKNNPRISSNVAQIQKI